MKNSEENIYDIELVYDEIIIDGDEDDTTSFKVYIALIDKKIIAKIPNNISSGERVRLRGMGKVKPDGTNGNAYISFNHIKYKKNIYNSNSYEYKVIDDIYDFNLEDELNKYGAEGWNLCQLIRKKDEYTIILERKI